MPRAPKNVDKLKFFKGKDGRWRVCGPGQPCRFTSRPTFKYRDKAGSWRDPRNRSRKTTPPARFDPRKKKTPGQRRKTLSDTRAAIRVRKHLNDSGKDSWKYKKVASIRDRFGEVTWRTVLEYETKAKPSEFTYANLQRALEKIKSDKTLDRAFDKRRTVWHVRFLDSDFVDSHRPGRKGERARGRVRGALQWHETSLAVSSTWKLSRNQALSAVRSLKQRYFAGEKVVRAAGRDGVEPWEVTSVILLLRLWIE